MLETLIEVVGLAVEMRRVETNAVRELLDWLDAHPMYAPRWRHPDIYVGPHELTGHWTVSEAEATELLVYTAEVLREGAHIGAITKDPFDGGYALRRKFPAGGKVSFTVYSEVCELRPTGRKVTKSELGYVDEADKATEDALKKALEQVRSKRDYIAVEVDEVEKVCPPLIER